MMLRAALAGAALWLSPAVAQTTIPNQGGPVMQGATIYLVFWLPSTNTFDASVSDGIGNYVSVLTNFFNNVSGTPYYSILTQYPGMCGSNTCLVQNSSTSVHVGGVFVDTRAYAHANGVAAAGSQTDPLFDPDIRHEIQSLIDQFALSDGLGAEFFVYVGSGVEECQGTDTTSCTFNRFCAHITTALPIRTAMTPFMPSWPTPLA
jgi:hypothetical protein